MATSWDEIKQLQEDLQRAQEATKKERLSDKNVVEVVNLLLNTSLLNVLFTLDGKEYVTHQQLEREIKDELHVHGGRINVVELQSLLNVDLPHIEARLSDVLKHDDSLSLLHGEILSEGYLIKMVEEVNDILQTSGKVQLSELSRQFNLPMDFLIETLQRMAGRLQGHMDHGMIYTEALISRYRARIRGGFSAVTKPTSSHTFMIREGFQESLFMSVLTSLLSAGDLSGVVHGRGERAVFVPHLYTQSQAKWVDAFYSANGYLDFAGMARVGVDDPKGFARSRYGQVKDCQVLQGCLLGPAGLAQLEACLDEMDSSPLWLDAMSVLPVACSEEDAQLLLERITKKREDLMVFDTVIYNGSFYQSCFESFKPIMTQKAEKDIATNQKFLLELTLDRSVDSFVSSSAEQPSSSTSNKKEERRRKAAGQAGSSKQGMQVREKKTHKVKDKGSGKGSRSQHGEGREEAESGPTKTIQFMDTEEILSTLQSNHADAPEDFLKTIASDLFLPLKHAYQEEAKKILESAKDRGKRHREGGRSSCDVFQPKVQELWSSAVLYGKTISLFEGFPKGAFEYQTWDSTVHHLSKHLLKTTCTELINLIVLMLSEDHMLPLSEKDRVQLSTERRNSIVSEFSGPVKSRLVDVCNSLGGKSVDVFFGKFEGLCNQDFVGIQLKRPDKKTERQIVFGHSISLASQLEEESAPAMAFHMAVVLVFTKVTGCLLQAPGRVLSDVLHYLEEQHKDTLSSEDSVALHTYHDLVVQDFKDKSKASHQGSSESDDNRHQQDSSNVEEVPEDNSVKDETVDVQLVERLAAVKAAALKYMSKAGRQKATQ